MASRASVDDGATKNTVKINVDNSACYVCHANYESEGLVIEHGIEEIGCVDCHGESTDHRNDEDNVTPPDIMYPLGSIDEKCGDYVGLGIAAWQAYQNALRKKKRIDAVAGDTASMLPMLMLARVDGKSPVEYLDDEKKRQLIRDFAAETVLEIQPDDPNQIMFDWLQRVAESFG